MLLNAKNHQVYQQILHYLNIRYIISERKLMIREFVYAHNFDNIWKRLHLADDDLIDLENILLENPTAGDLIQGTGGLRKTRFAIGNRGKSGGIRVLYVDFELYEKTYMLFAYPKNELENITGEQKNKFKKMIGILLVELRDKREKDGHI